MDNIPSTLSALSSFVLAPSAGRTVNIAGFSAGVEVLHEVIEYREAGKLTASNLLLSGDNPNRTAARARLSIDARTGHLASA